MTGLHGQAFIPDLDSLDEGEKPFIGYHCIKCKHGQTHTFRKYHPDFARIPDVIICQKCRARHGFDSAGRFILILKPLWPVDNQIK